MSARDELVKAFERSDELAVRRLGWTAVYEAASTWWLPRQPLTMPQFVHYAKALGNESPDAVLDAFRETAGEWRPTVGALLAAIKRKRQGGEKLIDVGRASDRSRSSDALEATRAALVAGEHVCGCRGPTAIRWVPDSLEHHTDKNGRRFALPIGVWRCPECHGIEPGQAFAAEDDNPHEAIQEAAA